MLQKNKKIKIMDGMMFCNFDSAILGNFSVRRREFCNHFVVIDDR